MTTWNVTDATGKQHRCMSRLIDEFGRDCGEIIETDLEDSADPDTDRYVVYVKREES